MTKTYTITGGTGYIGSQALKLLSLDKNNKIYAIVRSNSNRKIENENIEYVTYDGTEASIEEAIKNSDYLIHLAALYSTKTDEETTLDLIQSNIGFSTMLFNLANKVNKNIVISSASTFSSLTKEGAYAPSSLYAATKSAVETIAKYYSDLSVHFLTLPDTYGENDWRPKIHNILLKNKNWPFEFRSPSTQEMRIMHVEDVIGHFLKSLENGEKGVHFHDIYAEAELLTLKELSERITNKECKFNESAEKVSIPEKARSFSTKTGYGNKIKKFKL